MIKQTAATVKSVHALSLQASPSPYSHKMSAWAEVGRCRAIADFRASEQACAQRRLASPQRCVCDRSNGSGKISHVDPGIGLLGIRHMEVGDTCMMTQRKRW